MVDVLVLGYNAWDVSFPVGKPVPKDMKHEVAGIRSGGGGPGANAALALARLGARVKLVTVFGDDWPAGCQRTELERGGVNIDLSATAAGSVSPRAVIHVHQPGGERTIYWSRGTLPTLPANAVRPEWLDGAGLFYTDGHETAAATVLAREARRRGLPVVMDAGSVRSGSRELLAQATDVISSQSFAPELTGCDDPGAALRALRERGPRRVAMTFGAGGVVAWDGDQMVHVAAFAVPVVDTTGAGDAFHAGYARVRAEGWDFPACLEFGAAVAALKCTGWGGRAALPDFDSALELCRTGARCPAPAFWASPSR